MLSLKQKLAILEKKYDVLCGLFQEGEEDLDEDIESELEDLESRMDWLKRQIKYEEIAILEQQYSNTTFEINPRFYELGSLGHSGLTVQQFAPIDYEYQDRLFANVRYVSTLKQQRVEVASEVFDYLEERCFPDVETAAVIFHECETDNVFSSSKISFHEWDLQSAQQNVPPTSKTIYAKTVLPQFYAFDQRRQMLQNYVKSQHVTVALRAMCYPSLTLCFGTAVFGDEGSALFRISRREDQSSALKCACSSEWNFQRRPTRGVVKELKIVKRKQKHYDVLAKPPLLYMMHNAIHAHAGYQDFCNEEFLRYAINIAVTEYELTNG